VQQHGGRAIVPGTAELHKSGEAEDEGDDD
jgi:hypothetical protein